MRQFIAWTVGALFFLGLSWTFGYRAKDAWDEWHKKIGESTPKVEIRDSHFNQSPVITDSPGTKVDYRMELVAPSSYHEMDPSIEGEISGNLSRLVEKYKNVKVQIIVESESGNSVRTKVSKTLGGFLKKYNLGFFPEGNTYVGRFPDYPITVLYSAKNLAFAHDFANSIKPYISGETDFRSNLPSNEFIKIYLNGTPIFNEHGSIIFE